MKYTADDAKKMMIEVDNSKKMSNLYERARKSLEVDDLEHAAEYYKEILDENPNDWEAYFYSYLGEFATFTNGQASSVAAKLGNTIPAAYDMAMENCDEAELSERIKTITTKTVDRIVLIAATAAALLNKHAGGVPLTPEGKVNMDLYSRMRPTAQETTISCINALESLDSKIEEIANSKECITNDCKKENQLYIRQRIFGIANQSFSPNALQTEHLIKDEYIQKYAQKIKDLDPSFEIPTTQSTKSTNSSGGCYIATAVYGSYGLPSGLDSSPLSRLYTSEKMVRKSFYSNLLRD